jgi:excisionase family DNA binding protein
VSNQPDVSEHVPRRLATLDEAATYAGISRRTVHRWINAGHVVEYRVGPRSVRVDLDDLDRLLTPRPVVA